MHAQNRDFCVPHLHSSPRFCYATEKLEWRGYPAGENNFDDMFIRLTQLTNVTHRQTDRQTDGIGRAYA